MNNLRATMQLLSLSVLLGACGAAEEESPGARAQAIALVPRLPTPMTLRPTADQSQCVDIAGASTQDGAVPILYGCSGGRNERLDVLFPLDDPSLIRGAARDGDVVALRLAHSGKCLDVYGGDQASGTALIQWTCAYSLNQTFRLQADGAGFRLIARHSGQCVTRAPWFYGLVQLPCDGSELQRWSFVEERRPVTLSVDGAQYGRTGLFYLRESLINPGAPELTVDATVRLAAQVRLIGQDLGWRDPVSGDQLKLLLEPSGRCAEVVKDPLSDKIRTAPCEPGQDRQVFTVTQSSGGRLLRSITNGLCMRASIQGTCNPADSVQLWQLQPAP